MISSDCVAKETKRLKITIQVYLFLMNEKVLYPPLFEGDSDKSQDNNMSLSYDLRRSFDVVNEIHLSQKRLQSQDQNVDHHNGKVSAATDEKDMLQKKKCEAAIQAAVKAEAAIAALSNGIAELEDLLAKEETRGNHLNHYGSKSLSVGKDKEKVEFGS